MYQSNAKAKEVLFKHGYDNILIYGHHKKKFGGGMSWSYKNHSGIVTKRVNDAYSLFDGEAFNEFGKLVYIQIKSGRWAKSKPIEKFIEKKDVNALVFNVMNGEVRIRYFSHGEVDGLPQIVIREERFGNE